jgi:hypothetical protein
MEVVTFADGVDVEEAKGESGLSTEGGGDIGSNFLRFDGVTGAEAVEPAAPEVSSEECIRRNIECSRTQRIPVGLSSRHNP